MAHLELVSLVVRNYDVAIDFFVNVLQFDLVEDSPSTTNDGRPTAVGEMRIAPKLRASRSQLHRNARPLPLPPCNAITTGQARSAL